MGANFAAGFRAKFAAAVSTAAITGLVKTAIDEAAEIRDKSLGIGVTTERFQELDYIAKQTSTDVEVLRKAIAKVAELRGRALGGDQGSLGAFQAFGLNLDDLRMYDADTLFGAIAAHVHEVGSNVKTLSDLIRLFGDAGADILPAMATGMDELAEEARKAGVIIDNEMIQKLASAGDQLTTAWAKLKPIAADIATFFADAAVEAKNQIESLILFATTVGRTRSLSAGGEAVRQHQAKLQAEQKAFEEAMASRRGKPRGMPEEDRAAIEALARKRQLEEKFFAKRSERAFDALTAEQQISALEKKRDELMEKWAEAGPEGTARIEIATEIDELQEKIDRLRTTPMKEKEDQSPKSLFSVLGTDSLRSVGNFLGSDPNRDVVRQLERIDAGIEMIAENTRERPSAGGIFTV